ncbi:hypothetical protein B0H14DRAFT_2559645 [Mycena olivaceomarginata]|nr:hypothetical protein B0H14DRAFT_2559645 [Mycena olivaceomarginata]
MRFNKILGLACIAAAAILLGLVAFDVPYFKSIYFLRIELARGSLRFEYPLRNLGCIGILYGPSGRTRPAMLCPEDRLLSFRTGVNVIATALTKVLVLHIVGLVFTIIALGCGLLALLGMPFIAECCANLFSGLAAATALALLVFDLTAFPIIKKRVNTEFRGGGPSI